MVASTNCTQRNTFYRVGQQRFSIIQWSGFFCSLRLVTSPLITIIQPGVGDQCRPELTTVWSVSESLRALMYMQSGMCELLSESMKEVS